MQGKKTLVLLVIVAALVTSYVLVREAKTDMNDSRNVGNLKLQESRSTKETMADSSNKSVNNSNDKKMELAFKTTQEGTGDRVVKSGDTISVHYTGKLVDGTKFDSSLDRGTPFEFTIGQGMVIQGWEQGLLGMKVGEKRTLTIPSDMGYGARGAGGVIPPNADLIFDVELISIK